MTYVESLLVLCLLIAGVAAAQPISTTVDAGRGAVQVYYPSTYDGSEALPLIVGLHGFTGSGAGLESYFDLITQIEDQQFVYAFPDGSRNIFGRFWNATDACCGSGVDDSGYLRGLVELIQRDFNIDSQSIHFTGHSNGGFMSHRMAIDHADMVASIASLAGANFSRCGGLPAKRSRPCAPSSWDGRCNYPIRRRSRLCGIPWGRTNDAELGWVQRSVSRRRTNRGRI